MSTSKDKHLRLELDTKELYEAWQEIKKDKGIRSNTDLLRHLIVEEYKRVKEKKGKFKDYLLDKT